MTRFLIPAAFAGLCFVSASLVPAAAQDAAQPTLEQSELIIETGEATHVFTVELANDREEIATGMMFRTEMAPDAGMLFDLGDPRPVTFYMKNCIISLDMLFIDSEGEILVIAENAEPGSLRLVDPGVAVKGVLEINGGLSGQLGIVPGDHILHPVFASDGAE